MTSTFNPGAVEGETQGSLLASLVTGKFRVPENMTGDFRETDTQTCTSTQNPITLDNHDSPHLTGKPNLYILIFLLLFYFETGSCSVAEAGPNILLFLKNYHT